MPEIINIPKSSPYDNKAITYVLIVILVIVAIWRNIETITPAGLLGMLFGAIVPIYIFYRIAKYTLGGNRHGLKNLPWNISITIYIVMYMATWILL